MSQAMSWGCQSWQPFLPLLLPCVVAPVPWGRARILAPAEQSDFQPSWPPGPTAQRPLSTLRKPHPEKKNVFFSAFTESTMTPRQEVWKSVVTGPKGLHILGLSLAACFSPLLWKARCRAALWEVLPMPVLPPAGFAYPARSTLCTSLLLLVQIISSHQPVDLHRVSGAAIFST